MKSTLEKLVLTLSLLAPSLPASAAGISIGRGISGPLLNTPLVVTAPTTVFKPATTINPHVLDGLELPEDKVTSIELWLTAGAQGIKGPNETINIEVFNTDGTQESFPNILGGISLVTDHEFHTKLWLKNPIDKSRLASIKLTADYSYKPGIEALKGLDIKVFNIKTVGNQDHLPLELRLGSFFIKKETISKIFTIAKPAGKFTSLRFDIETGETGLTSDLAFRVFLNRAPGEAQYKSVNPIYFLPPWGKASFTVNLPIPLELSDFGDVVLSTLSYHPAPAWDLQHLTVYGIGADQVPVFIIQSGPQHFDLEHRLTAYSHR